MMYTPPAFSVHCFSSLPNASVGSGERLRRRLSSPNRERGPSSFHRLRYTTNPTGQSLLSLSQILSQTPNSAACRKKSHHPCARPQTRPRPRTRPRTCVSTTYPSGRFLLTSSSRERAPAPQARSLSPPSRRPSLPSRCPVRSSARPLSTSSSGSFPKKSCDHSSEGRWYTSRRIRPLQQQFTPHTHTSTPTGSRKEILRYDLPTCVVDSGLTLRHQIHHARRRGIQLSG